MSSVELKQWIQYLDTVSRMSYLKHVTIVLGISVLINGWVYYKVVNGHFVGDPICGIEDNFKSWNLTHKIWMCTEFQKGNKKKRVVRPGRNRLGTFRELQYTPKISPALGKYVW